MPPPEEMDRPTTAGETPGPSRRPRALAAAARAIVKIAILGAALALAWKMASRIGWPALADRVGEADRALLVAALIALALRFVAWERRWSLALDPLGAAGGAGRRLTVLLASVFANHVTPSLRVIGGILRARYMVRPAVLGGPRFARLYGSVVFDQFVHHATSWAVTWMAVVAVAFALGRRGLGAGALALGAALALAAGLSGKRLRQSRLLRRAAERAGRRVERLRPILDRGRPIVSTTAELAARPGLVRNATLYSLAYVLLNLAGQWLLFRAIGVDVDPLTVGAVVGLGALAGFATGTPGGVGSTEAAMIAGFAALGVDQIEAVAGTLLYRGLHYGVVAVLGLPSLVYHELRQGSGKPGAATASPVTDRDPRAPEPL